MLFKMDSERLKRYKNIAMLLIKYGNKNVIQTSSPGDALESEILEGDTEKGNGKDTPEELAHDLEELGPTFIKLGQLLSTRSDFLSQPYIDALTRLQDNVKPFEFSQVEEIIQAELGIRMSKAFMEFDSKPIAAASLGQVHKAKLRDGKPVAVKVQRPDIRETIIGDLDALEEIAGALDRHTDTGRRYSFQNILKEFRKSLIQELDYRQEAQNLIKLNQNLERYENIIVPQPIEDYSSSKVLTMDYVRGMKVTSLSPLAQLDLNGKALAEDLFKAYLDQILIDGFFHADPHPGNVFITDDQKIALIDLGMVARIDPEAREDLLKLLLYVSDGRGKDAAEVSKHISTLRDDFNEQAFENEISEFVVRSHDITLDQIDVGRVVVELSRIATRNGVQMPTELTMLGKTLLNLDLIGRTLDPEFNPNEVIRRHADTIFRRHLFRKASPGNIFSTLLETNELVQKLPLRLNTLLDSLAGNKFRISVDAFDDSRLMQNLQKIANRITLGLILAALIIGAALMMRVSSDFTILGYPGLAMVMFLAAAAFGFGLVIMILLQDDWKNRKKK